MHRACYRRSLWYLSGSCTGRLQGGRGLWRIWRWQKLRDAACLRGRHDTSDHFRARWSLVMALGAFESDDGVRLRTQYRFCSCFCICARFRCRFRCRFRQGFRWCYRGRRQGRWRRHRRAWCVRTALVARPSRVVSGDSSSVGCRRASATVLHRDGDCRFRRCRARRLQIRNEYSLLPWSILPKDTRAKTYHCDRHCILARCRCAHNAGIAWIA
jgi:hypothetical protein